MFSQFNTCSMIDFSNTYQTSEKHADNSLYSSQRTLIRPEWIPDVLFVVQITSENGQMPPLLISFCIVSRKDKGPAPNVSVIQRFYCIFSGVRLLLNHCKPKTQKFIMDK